MRLATWNVNSIRARVDRVTDWLERADVDVLAMQETKCSDDQFPTMPFAALGYDVVHCGFNQWNGVAIASRVGIDDVAGRLRRATDWSDKPEVEAAAEARALGATCGGVRVWSLYVPNGRTVEDPALRLQAGMACRAARYGRRLADRRPGGTDRAWSGDWNIAPTDEDVWSVEFYQRQHARHRTGAGRVQRDRRRPIHRRGAAFHPGPGIFTYWDYTQLRFPKSRGMRIDFILGSPALAARVTHAEIVREERKRQEGHPAPSDHAPVFIDLT